HRVQLRHSVTASRSSVGSHWLGGKLEKLISINGKMGSIQTSTTSNCSHTRFENELHDDAHSHRGKPARPQTIRVDALSAPNTVARSSAAAFGPHRCWRNSGVVTSKTVCDAHHAAANRLREQLLDGRLGHVDEAVQVRGQKRPKVFRRVLCKWL